MPPDTDAHAQEQAHTYAHARRDDQPEETRRVLLSRTFDEDAELYDRARPGYSPELYDDLVDLAGARPGRRVLEIGCGTGQATVPLAALGYSGHRALPDAARNGLLACVAGLIDGRYDGRVTKRYLIELAVSQ
ncbi:hypothetical protein PV689_24895 [Streptomyces sp. ATCC51928]|uniref:Class I SAM-dependent methyltransferase n=1 Tax=Streptomyces caviscabies TaxID=90079 RepID=A0ABW2MD83_9ACTN|nr:MULTISPECIES: hypothetical protein [unclassified Streptomyces]MDX3505167.1 hypothetical protein [Streptomyces sp. ATCC51928]MDX5524640.1 hypothetical protein [Streptomyces sp. DE06-01C]